jgi:leucyl-tRNA synthetase
MESGYDFTSIEDRWGTKWIADKEYSAPGEPDPERHRYMVTMFPYPSGDLHMGHVEIFSIHDSIVRFNRMLGYEVLSPIGWDAFGLPAENAAIKRDIHPARWTFENIAKHRTSMERLGCSFDWDRVFYTCEPDFYRWNQYLFVKFYEQGLAYRKKAPANWCPHDKTVLANEQVINGRCERCNTLVVKRYLTQWFFKVTDYAERLLDDMELNIGWNDRLKMLQRNWIGRSYGAEVEFEIDGEPEDDKITVFTTRPDTLWGATFFVLAPEHELASRLVAGTSLEEQLSSFRDEVGRMSEADRTSADRPKRGLFSGRYVINPVNGERIPIWVADYVLMDYGTGAIMAVPAHDGRDFDFARAYDIAIRAVVEPEEGSSTATGMTGPFVGRGVLVNSGRFDGTSTDVSVKVVTDWLQETGRGRHAVNFRLRDWLISRQRYWGTPIPIVYCEEHGEVPVPVEDLPITLPDVVDFRPTGEESPLAAATDWVNTTCPVCGRAARRETDTMDTFVDSAWYFHRYLDAHNENVPFDPEISKAWMPMDLYTGGIEHAVLHLIYARFFQKVFCDMGLADAPEPFPNCFNHGTVTMGGKRMSKSRGNLVEPVEAFGLYGADALRLYLLFSGPPDADFDWPEEGVTSIGRVTFPWLERVWRLCEEIRATGASDRSDPEFDNELRRVLHRTISVVSDDYRSLSFNTAIARLMELVNAGYRYRSRGGQNRAVLDEFVSALLKLLAPMAPYLTEEQWHRLGNEGSVHFESWPEFDDDLARRETVTMVVQVNGKVRDTLDVPAEVTEERMTELALASDKVRSHLGGREPARVIVRPPKLVSLVAAGD